MSINIIFLNSTWPPGTGTRTNVLTLHYDDWDDFGYKTSFHMTYCDTNRETHSIGAIKIARLEETNSPDIETKTRKYFPDNISQLNSKFFSLGQDLQFYEKLKHHFPTEYLSIFKRLNDIATNEELKEQFIDFLGVQQSLLRESSAIKAFNEALDVLNNRKVHQDISFSYRYKPPYSDNSTIIPFDFSPSQHLYNRINIIVGKNGVGKTQFLTALTDSLSGYVRTTSDNCFWDDRPLVDKVMSISYSAFDPFRKPKQDGVCSYVYCGIQSEDGALSIVELQESFTNARTLIKERDREDIWIEIMKELLEDEHQSVLDQLDTEDEQEKHWSSGQSILICTLTEVISKIENESIILFDEPEIHLHPNAISNVMRMLYKLLQEFNSYAILSTHSPIILQEIPSKYVHILDRLNNYLTVREPTIECFGNNISEITTQVFDVSTRESNFKPKLQELSSKMDYKEVLDLFENNLSLGAMMFLKSCYDS